ncbi:MAG: urease accessory protein UreE [Alphaproteobacteria bacterium]|nr:urease accessory protein UreE [Alphaproteobacteria bacterium]
MKRGFAIRRAGRWNPATAVDRIVLDADDRYRRRIVLKGEAGTEFLLDLDEAVALRDGDGIVLDDGATVAVSGRPEPLVAVAARRPIELVRLAWHLGNRHTDVQIADDGLRIRRDHVLEQMLRGLGATVIEIEAPFDPEAGASGGHRGHDHGG